jgi:hypothetical protein
MVIFKNLQFVCTIINAEVNRKINYEQAEVSKEKS